MMRNALSYTDTMLDELHKCVHDPIYFINTYCLLTELTEHKLYDYQQDYVESIHINDRNICNWTRQTGKTYVSLAYVLWASIFWHDKNILLMGPSSSHTDELFKNLKYMYDILPVWMKPNILESNRQRMTLSNGNKIHTSYKFSNLRGMSISLLYVDEFALFKDAPEIFDCIPALCSTTGKLIISSTSREKSVFNELCYNSLCGLNNFIVYTASWNQVPGRDKKFKEKMISMMGLAQWKREYE